jgi:hypothetical protein
MKKSQNLLGIGLGFFEAHRSLLRMGTQNNLGFEHKIGTVYSEAHGGFPFWVMGRS